MDLHTLVSALVSLIINSPRIVLTESVETSFTILYTNQTLDHYSNLTAKSLLRCSMSCQLSNCSAFGYAEVNTTDDTGHQCLLYDASVRDKLTNIWSPDAASIHTVNLLIPDAADCQQHWEIGQREAGVYRLSPPGVESFTAWCEFDNSNGWTVIQRRFDGSQDFYLYWSAYKNGFGNINGEFWLGNDNIYALTNQNRQLSIFLQKYDGSTATANYSTFYINSEADNYKLTVSGYSGDANDALAGGTGHSHDGSPFSTRDQDNDNFFLHCAVQCTGAWWYNSCYDANLNGVLESGSSVEWGNIVWDGFWGEDTTATIHRTTMMITRN